MVKSNGLTTHGIMVMDYLKKFPSASNTNLARMIMEQNPEGFADAEAVRSLIRYYRGASGDKLRGTLRPEHYHPKLTIPGSDLKEFLPFVLTAADSPLVGVGDVHVPYHDRDALEIAIERAVKVRAKTFLLAGDWLDFHQLSHFQKDPRMRDPLEEISLLLDIIEIIHKALPKARLIYKLGNHEERFDNYLMEKAPALFNIEEFHLIPYLTMRLKERGIRIEFVTGKRVIHLGSLNIIHGHEYKFAISNPVNPARGLYTRAKKSAICWHHHRSSSHSESSIRGDVTTTWSVGCMCDLHPDYNPLAVWNLGFAEIYLEEDGLFRVINREIVRYQIM